jgi:hypothetical protein
MTFQKTNQDGYFRCIETKEFFPDDGENRLSVEMRANLADGIAPLEYAPPTYSDKRRAAYLAEISRDDFMEAYFEERAGDPAKMDALQARRLEIKSGYPKE